MSGISQTTVRTASSPTPTSAASTFIPEAVPVRPKWRPLGFSKSELPFRVLSDTIETAQDTARVLRYFARKASKVVKPKTEDDSDSIANEWPGLPSFFEQTRYRGEQMTDEWSRLLRHNASLKATTETLLNETDATKIPALRQEQERQLWAYECMQFPNWYKPESLAVLAGPGSDHNSNDFQSLILSRCLAVGRHQKPRNGITAMVDDDTREYWTEAKERCAALSANSGASDAGGQVEEGTTFSE